MTDKSDHVMEAMSPLGLYPLAHNNATGGASSEARSAMSAFKSPELGKQRDEAERKLLERWTRKLLQLSRGQSALFARFPRAKPMQHYKPSSVLPARLTLCSPAIPRRL